MMRRTKPNQLFTLMFAPMLENYDDCFPVNKVRPVVQRTQQSAHFVVDQPYYLKPSPMNPYLGAVHDGVSTEYGKGFTVKPIHHLYRFTHNILPTNIDRATGRMNPECKMIHWQDNSWYYIWRARWFHFDNYPLAGLIVFISCLVSFHLIRCWFWNPDITWYNMAFPTNKNFVSYVRFNSKHPMDQPVQRYVPQGSEYYMVNSDKRAMIKLDLIHNDPWINHVKAIGRADELLATTAPHAPANWLKRTVVGSGPGNLNPAVFNEKSEWWTPVAEQNKENYAQSWRENYGNKAMFWSLWNNLGF